MKFLRFSLLAVLAIAGCTHEQFVTGARHPEVAVDAFGTVTYRGNRIDPEDLPAYLRESGLGARDTIHIRIPAGLDDYRYPYHVMGILVKNGFTRPVFVEDRRAYSEVRRPSRATPSAPSRATFSAPAQPTARPAIRYK